MAVVEMAKVALFSHHQIKNQVIGFLHEAGALELTELPSPPENFLKITEAGSEELEMELVELRAAIEFIEKVEGKKKGFIESFAPTRPVVQEEALRIAYKNFDWKAITKQIQDIESEIGNLNNLMHRLEADRALLLPWTGLDIPLRDLSCTIKSCILTGKLKKKLLPQLMENIGELAATEVVDRTENEVFLLIVYYHTEEKKLTDLLDEMEFDKIILPISDRSAQEEISNIDSLRLEAKKKKDEFIAQARGLIKHKEALMEIHDYVSIRKQRKEARARSLNSSSVNMLTGWIRKNDEKRIRAGLDRISDASALFIIEPEEGEVPPTVISNPAPLTPFELITKIFGLPNQGEIDPTAPLSFFYLLFFAICLSDAGYGIILAAAALYLLKKLQLTEGGKNLLTLMFWGGLLTIVAGILTGSYFSIDLNSLPAGAAKNFLLSLQLINPIKNPLNVLMLSLLLGVIQNIFGLAIGLYWNIKNQKYLDGLLDFGLWIFFLLSLVGYAVTAYTGSVHADLMSKLSIAGAVLLVLTQGRKESNLLKKAATGILSLYRTTSFLGDTLSYSRLLALMMTTSIIGMVVNIIADLTRNSVPILGYVIMLLILLIGHTFNLVVSVLGAFIHSLRLQLVEFFGKFYEGGGRVFRPFSRETKYVLIKD